MSGVNNLVDNAGKAIEIVPKIYDDGLKETTKETGEILALIPKTINAALAPLRQWIAQKEYNVAETEKILSIKLEKISPEDVVSPEAFVAVPAIQAISYCMDSEELREMYANLLSKSMVKTQKNLVHPAFVEIIKQLSPDEAKLLKHISNNRKGLPIINIKLENEKGQYRTILQHFTNIAEGICEQPTNITSYLDNLERLKLIDIPWSVYLSDDAAYEDLLNHEEIKTILESQAPEGWKFKADKGKFEVTQFGELFIDTCIEDIKN